jgi:hypothetical protein
MLERTRVDESLKSEWLHHCLRLAGRRSNTWAASRKVFLDQRMTLWLDDSVSLKDAGYTDKKLSNLIKLYVHDASRNEAIEQWQRRSKGTVTFDCLNHQKKRAGITGEQGPCLREVTITDLGNKVVANVHYRSVEICKKFVGDLVFLREVLFKPFGAIDTITFEFASITVHPIYFWNLIPLLDDPVATLGALQQRDSRFLLSVAKQDLLNPHGMNAKFASAQRVAKFVRSRTDPATLKDVLAYLRSVSMS